MPVQKEEAAPDCGECEKVLSQEEKVAQLMASLLQEDGVSPLRLLQSLFLTTVAQTKMSVSGVLDTLIAVVFREAIWPEPLQECTLLQGDEKDPDTWFIKPADRAPQN